MRPGADNSAALLAARRSVSAAKRQQVVDTVRDMLREGVPVTFSSVAKRAQVSAGLVHSPNLKTLIADAIAQQATTGITPAAAPVAARVSAQSLQQDLSLARNEIRDLRAENDRLRLRLKRDLGAQMHAIASQDALARIGELEDRNRDLVAQHDQVTTDNRRLTNQVAALEDDLLSSRTAHSRLMREVNSARSSETSQEERR